PVVCVALVAEAVRPVPGPVGPDQARDNDTGMEPGELPGAARDGDHSLTAGEIEYDMAERGAVAPARRVEDDVTIQHGRTRRDGIDHPRADLDVLEVRGCDRAEATGEPRVLRALLCYVERPAARFATVLVGLLAAHGDCRQTRYDLLRSCRVRASGGHETGDDSGGDEKFAADHLSLRSTGICYRETRSRLTGRTQPSMIGRPPQQNIR